MKESRNETAEKQPMHVSNQDVFVSNVGRKGSSGELQKEWIDAD